VVDLCRYESKLNSVNIVHCRGHISIRHQNTLNNSRRDLYGWSYKPSWFLFYFIYFAFP